MCSVVFDLTHSSINSVNFLQLFSVSFLASCIGSFIFLAVGASTFWSWGVLPDCGICCYKGQCRWDVCLACQMLKLLCDNINNYGIIQIKVNICSLWTCLLSFGNHWNFDYKSSQSENLEVVSVCQRGKLITSLFLIYLLLVKHYLKCVRGCYMK